MTSKIHKSFLYWELLILFLLACLPRLWRLPSDLQITYDQGLHSQAVWNIWHEGKLSLLGHPTDVDGIYHAPIYYWLMLPFYVMGKGNPVYPAIWQALTHSFSAVLIYLLAWRLFDRRTARISAVLFAVSFGFVCFARWLSNVTLVIPFSLILFLTLERVKRNSPSWFPVSCLMVALIIELNGAIGVFLIPLLLIFFSSRTLILSGLAFFLPHLPLLIFNLRHQWINLVAIFKYSSSGQSGIGVNISTWIYDLLTLGKELHKILSWDLLPVTAFVLVITSLYLFKYRQRWSVRFLTISIFVPILGLLFYRRGAIGFFFWAVLPLCLILISYSLSRLPRQIFYFALILLITINIFQWKNFLSPHLALTPMGTKNLIMHQDRLQAVDWIYQKAAGKNIYLWMYTIPYLLEDPWRYYFVWYAKSKYGYLPTSWGGLSSTQMASDSAFFAIYEPDYDRPGNLSLWLSRLNREFPQTVGSFNFHDVWIEYRQ